MPSQTSSILQLYGVSYFIINKKVISKKTYVILRIPKIIIKKFYFFFFTVYKNGQKKYRKNINGDDKTIKKGLL